MKSPPKSASHGLFVKGSEAILHVGAVACKTMCPFIRSSSMKAFNDCPRKFFLTDRLGIMPRRVSFSEATTIGNYCHAALSALYTVNPASDEDVLDTISSAIADRMTEDLERMSESLTKDAFLVGADPEKTGELLSRCADMANAMIRIFWNRYPLGPDIEILASEELLALELVLPPLQGAGIPIAGQIDTILKESSTGAIWPTDHKTSGDTAEDASVGRGWSYQTRLYRLLVAAKYGDPTGFIHNFIQRPTIKFCKKDADFDAYVTRCREWYAARKSDTYDQAMASYWLRHTEPLIPPELIRDLVNIYGASTINVGSVSGSDFDAVFPRREQSCRAWNSTCVYLPFCDQPKTDWPRLLDIKGSYTQEFPLHEGPVYSNAVDPVNQEPAQGDEHGHKEEE